MARFSFKPSEKYRYNKEVYTYTGRSGAYDKPIVHTSVDSQKVHKGIESSKVYGGGKLDLEDRKQLKYLQEEEHITKGGISVGDKGHFPLDYSTGHLKDF